MIKLNGHLIQFTSFPNGETLLAGDEFQHATPFAVNAVSFKYETDADLIRLLLFKRHLDNAGCLTELRIHYLPYSRMDRVEGNSVFSLKYIAEFINGLGFDRIVVAEPHSDVSMALLDRSSAIYPSIQLLPTIMELVGFDKDRDCLFYPDAGAQKRYSRITGYRHAVGFKRRDFATGQLAGMEIVGNGLAGHVDGGGNIAIILDDLCSKGGTFALAAELLRGVGFAKIFLLTTHCENVVSQGPFYKRHLIRDKTAELIERSGIVDGVFTTNSIFSQEDGTGLVTVFDIEPFFEPKKED